MPTQRQRVTLTLTPDVEERIDRAADRFPELAGRDRELLLRLTELGAELLETRGDGDPREEAKERILAMTREMTPDEGAAMIAERDAQWEHDLIPGVG